MVVVFIKKQTNKQKHFLLTRMLILTKNTDAILTILDMSITLG